MRPATWTTETGSSPPPRERGAKAGAPGGWQSRQYHAPDGLNSRAARGSRGLSDADRPIPADRFHDARGQRKANGHHRHGDGQPTLCEVGARWHRHGADPPTWREQRGPRDRHDRPRQRERHVDQRVRHSSPAETEHTMTRATSRPIGTLIAAAVDKLSRSAARTRGPVRACPIPAKHSTDCRTSQCREGQGAVMDSHGRIQADVGPTLGRVERNGASPAPRGGSVERPPSAK